MISVEVRIWTTTDGEDVHVARLLERFMVRGRTGSAELAAPAPLAKQAKEATRARLDRFTVTAPRTWPRSPRSAATTTRCTPTSLPRASPASTARSCTACGSPPSPSARPPRSARRTTRAASAAGWPAGSPRCSRAPRSRSPSSAPACSVGDTVVEVSCRASEDGELAMVAQAVVAAPRTAYAFPGQGIQSQGMGLEARTRSAAARKVWDRADAHTRDALGFSILAVVRDNPTDLWADGELHRHPDGVLFLTQFTQVAMATLAVAQVAEMREAGVFVEGAITCGHSVGEYNALAAVTGILPLEALLEIVFRRGMAMHHLVPRDAEGRSNYRLAAIRPSQIDLADDDVADFVAEVSDRSGEFIQIVNYNLRGSQYAIAGTVAGLKALEAEVEERRAARRRQAGVHPGAGHRRAVPLLGAARRRRRLPRTSRRPAAGDASTRRCWSGRYIPNLVPRLFTLDREFVEEVASYVDSPLLEPVLEDWAAWEADPARLGRTLLIELLAWQFASPVRWIETQDLLFGCARARRPRHRAVRRGRRRQRAHPGQPGRADHQAPVVRRGRAEDRELLPRRGCRLRHRHPDGRRRAGGRGDEPTDRGDQTPAEPAEAKAAAPPPRPPPPAPSVPPT